MLAVSRWAEELYLEIIGRVKIIRYLNFITSLVFISHKYITVLTVGSNPSNPLLLNGIDNPIDKTVIIILVVKK